MSENAVDTCAIVMHLPGCTLTMGGWQQEPSHSVGRRSDRKALRQEEKVRKSSTWKSSATAAGLSNKEVSCAVAGMLK